MIKKPLNISMLKQKRDNLNDINCKLCSEILNLRQRFKKSSESERVAIQYVIDRNEDIYHDSLRQVTEITESLNKNSAEEKSSEITLDKKFQPLSCLELLSLPKKKWLVDQIFGPGDVGMVYGAPGCGKTFVVIDMIVKFCTGGQWANRFDINRPLNIAYCAGEGVSGLPSRFDTSLKHHNVEPLQNFTFYKNVPQFYEDSSGDFITILQFISEWKESQLAKERESLDLLVIDTLHTASVAADENSAQDMGRVLKACRLAAEQLGCAVILVHHTNKGGTAERGSSALRGAMDFMIRIERPEKGTGTGATMFCSKLKDGEQWKDQDFHLSVKEDCSSVYVLWNDPNEQETNYTKGKENDRNRILQELQNTPGSRLSCKALSEKIGQTSNYTNKLLNELVDKNKCKVGLKNSEKEYSPQNPWVYFL